jgi:hypothetical protein
MAKPRNVPPAAVDYRCRFEWGICEVWMTRLDSPNSDAPSFHARAFLVQADGTLKPVLHTDGEPVQVICDSIEDGLERMALRLAPRFGPLRGEPVRQKRLAGRRL